MEIYIEIVILEQMIIHLLSFISAIILVNQFLSLKATMFHTLSMSLISFNMYINIPIVFIYIYIFIIHLFIFKKKVLQFYLCYMISYFIFIFSLLQLNSFSGYQNGVYLIFKNGIWTIVLLLIIFLCYFIHSFLLKRRLALQQLYYQIQFQNNKQNYDLKAFLDTGNHVTYLGKPVIFINQLKFSEPPTSSMQIKSVNGISEVPLVYLKKIKINDEVYNDLYIGQVSKFSDDYDVLLNVALLYKG